MYSREKFAKSEISCSEHDILRVGRLCKTWQPYDISESMRNKCFAQKMLFILVCDLGEIVARR